MTDTYPAIVLRYKEMPSLYIGEGDYDTKDINEAFMYVTEDGSTPDKERCKEVLLREEKFYRQAFTEAFGENAIINFRPSEWFKLCDLVIVEISKEKYKELPKNG